MVKIKTIKRIQLVHAYKASKDEYTYLWKYIHLDMSRNLDTAISEATKIPSTPHMHPPTS